jgi:hypothetical protein
MSDDGLSPLTLTLLHDSGCERVPRARAYFNSERSAAAGRTPLYFTFDLVGRSYPPAITHPDFYYGFVSVAWVWQIAFLMIAGNPVRHRPFMLAAILEKLIYVTTMVSLYVNGNVHLGQAAVAIPDSCSRCCSSALSPRRRKRTRGRFHTRRRSPGRLPTPVGDRSPRDPTGAAPTVVHPCIGSGAENLSHPPTALPVEYAG